MERSFRSRGRAWLNLMRFLAPVRSFAALHTLKVNLVPVEPQFGRTSVESALIAATGISRMPLELNMCGPPEGMIVTTHPT